MAADERREEKGPEGRSWLLRQEHAFAISIASFLLFGTGGFASHSSLGGKMDAQTQKIEAQGEKLDGVKLSLTELKGKIDASEASGARDHAEIAALTARVGLLEQQGAARDAQIQALREKGK